MATIGGKTGPRRATPLTVVEHEGRTDVVASYGGDDRHRAWNLNLGAPTSEGA